jgi:hypothetical protein
MNEGWLYYGVFFSRGTKEFLIKKAKELTDIPNTWPLYADHMTIVYNDGSEEKNEYANKLCSILGWEQQLRITSIGISDEAIAFGVNDYKTQNEHSHITIAVAPGSKPVKSNKIKEWLPIDGFYVTGTIDRITKKK